MRNFLEVAYEKWKAPTPRDCLLHAHLWLLHCGKKYFRQQKIKFRDVDVSCDKAAARDMTRRSGQMGVPVVDIGGKIVVGLDRPKIDRLLGIN